ncbi:MAG: Na/Pi cotransporter family protein [Bacteroidales bacterium]|nr:Na/Pi cotransporter family protein [Bacteroidales bacterium]
MDYSFFDFLKLIGSLGMFLYGMKVMSEGLQKATGDKLRSILSAMTNNRVMGVLTGVMITALIQSSSATTVMVVSFVNAGLLSLAQSISVIMGANVGTTVTAWIISLFGFKISISAFSLPVIAISIPFLFSKSSKRKSIGEFLIGFALLFLGLDYLKNSVPDIQNNPEILGFLKEYTSMGYLSILLFLLIGTIVTVIVQSSSATMAITLIMCSKGWISFEIAAAMILGENIGTTITANLAALSANVSAKRAAFAHLLFNLFGVCWMLIFFYPFTRMIAWLVTNYGPGDPYEITSFLSTVSPSIVDQVTESPTGSLTPDLTAIQTKLVTLQVAVSYALSLFHTIFNILNVCIMIWFVKFYVYFCSKVIKPKTTDEEEFHLQYIPSRMLSTSELSVLQAKKEIAQFGERARQMFDFVKSYYHEKDENNGINLFNRIEKYEKISDHIEIEIANYINDLSEGRLSFEAKSEIHSLILADTEIESITDACLNMARVIKHRNEKNSPFTDEMHQNVTKMFSYVDKALSRMTEVLHLNEPLPSDVNASYNIENEINNFRNSLKMRNFEAVNTKKYAYQDGIYYMDIIAACERMGDYILNVVQAVTDKKLK